MVQQHCSMRKGVMQVLGEERRWAVGQAVEAARHAAHRDERMQPASKAGAGLPAARRQLHELAEVRAQMLGAGRLHDQRTELSHSRYSTAALSIVRQSQSAPTSPPVQLHLHIAQSPLVQGLDIFLDEY